MARIPMTSGFTLIPEGTYVFRIYDVSYDETFGKMIEYFKDKNIDALTHTERFSIKDGNGQPNEKALNAFSYFAKTALNDFSLEDVDPEELIDCYIEAEVTHTKQPNRNDPTKTVTFANLGDKSPASGFDTEATQKALTMGRESEAPKSQATAPTGGGLDLDSLLG